MDSVKIAIEQEQGDNGALFIHVSINDNDLPGILNIEAFFGIKESNGLVPLSRFNVHAQHVLSLAREEALSFNHQFIGTEHLLLGLLLEQEGVAALALAKLGVALDSVRAAVAEKIGRGDQPVREEIDYVPRARKVLSLALDEAERQGSAYVRTEHILLGMVRDGSGVGADILDTLGVLGKVRAQVFALLG